MEARDIQKKFSENAMRRWAHVTKGLTADQRRITSAVMESQHQYMSSKGQLTEETLSTDAGSYNKYVFPILRRLFPNLLAPQLVSVQPMSAPSGSVFYYDYKYGDDKGSDGEGNALVGKNLIETFGKFYSSEYIDYEVVAVAAAATSGTLKWIPIVPKNTTNERSVIITTTVGADAVEIEDDGAGNFVATSDVGGHFTSGTINYTTGAVSIVYNAATTADVVAAYYFNSEQVAFTDGAKIPSIKLSLTMDTIQAESRMLRYVWSAEAADDFKSLYGLNADRELVAGAANEVKMELDRELIMELQNGAQFSAAYTHSPTGWNPAGQATEIESIRHLITVIEQVAARIHTATKRAPANFIVASPQVVGLLSQLTTHGDYVATGPSVIQPSSFGQTTSNFGVDRVGTLRNKFAVYQDPYQPAGEILIGLKTDNFLDAGYVYAPYVPLEITAPFQDPNDFSTRRGMRTRYGKKMLRPEFYGTVTVSGLPTVNG